MIARDRDARPWLVQKYGGTSVGKLLDKITGSIIPEYLAEYNVAIICSARSSASKSAGTTNLLLRALASAVSEQSSESEVTEVIDMIEEEHLLVAGSLADASASQSHFEVIQNLRNRISAECEALRKLLEATRVIGEASDKMRDRVLGVGEKLSCLIVAAALSVQGVEAEMLNLENIVEAAGECSERDRQLAYRQNPTAFLLGLRYALRETILNCSLPGKVPVITGFFGSTPDSLLRTVGRGYSDLCAALCAVSLGAEELQIWKEVDGILTADPTKVSTARVLPMVTREEAVELTYYGSEVINPLTMSILEVEDIVLRLKNVKDPAGAGTVVYSVSSPSPPRTPDLATMEMSRSIFMASNGYHGKDRARRTPTAITTKDSTLITISSNGKLPAQDFLVQATSMLKKHHLTVDLASTSRQSISVAVSVSESLNLSNSVQEALPYLEELGSTAIVPKMSIISVVGHKMRNMVGVAAEIFSALATAQINIRLISQGASEINISFVVRTQDALLAMEVIHAKVLLVPGQTERESSLITGE
jgi:aspartate kinase